MLAATYDEPIRTAQVPQMLQQDHRAVRWWEGGASPTTNDARNGDVEKWWADSQSSGAPAAAVEDLTGGWSASNPGQCHLPSLRH